MANIAQEIIKIKELYSKAQEVLIATHENPDYDSMGSALALYLGLIAAGKKATVVCPTLQTVKLSNFVGANKVVSQLAVKKNFVISLDYIDGSIEKVSYNIEGDKFNLVVENRPGFEPFSADKVSYSYSGGAAELIFVVDTIHLGGLGRIYEENKDLFAGRAVVNIDHHPNNTHYGQINLVETKASSTAELVAELMSGLNIRLTADIATNLLNAIYGATDNFTAEVSPMAFEVSAVCLRAGGKRFRKSQAVSEEVPSIEAVRSEPSFGAAPFIKPNVAPKISEGQHSGPAVQAPADWLKPKIYKSSSNLL